MANPKISVIIPVHHAPESLLRMCFESVMKQSLQDIEIIVVAIGTQEKVFEIVKEYNSKDDLRLKVFSDKEDCKPGHALNIGLALSTGDYVSFIDEDDSVNLDFYEKLYEATRNGFYDVVIGNVNLFREGNAIIKCLKASEFFDDDCFSYRFNRFYQSAIYRREYLLIKGIIFPDWLRRGYEDCFLAKVATNPRYGHGHIKIAPEAYYHHTVHCGKVDTELLSNEALEDTAKARYLCIREMISQQDYSYIWLSAYFALRMIADGTRSSTEEGYEIAAKGFIEICQIGSVSFEMLKVILGRTIELEGLDETRLARTIKRLNRIERYTVLQDSEKSLLF